MEQSIGKHKTPQPHSKMAKTTLKLQIVATSDRTEMNKDKAEGAQQQMNRQFNYFSIEICRKCKYIGHASARHKIPKGEQFNLTQLPDNERQQPNGLRRKFIWK